MFDWLMRSRLETKAELARSRALSAALDFAMASDDFGQAECERFMKLAFEAGDGAAYAKAVGWMARRGGWGPEGAKRMARSSYFNLRPGALGAIAKAWPQVLEASDDGIDLLGSGLSMAILSGDQEAAVALAQAGASVEGGAERVKRALESAIEEASGLFGLDEDEDDAGSKAARIVSLCERALLSACSGASEGEPRKGLAKAL